MCAVDYNTAIQLNNGPNYTTVPTKQRSELHSVLNLCCSRVLVVVLLYCQSVHCITVSYLALFTCHATVYSLGEIFSYIWQSSWMLQSAFASRTLGAFWLCFVPYWLLLTPADHRFIADVLKQHRLWQLNSWSHISSHTFCWCVAESTIRFINKIINTKGIISYKYGSVSRILKVKLHWFDLS